MNVGVRLGEISKVGQGYLAAIDLDVKGMKPEHQAEARAKLFELFPIAKHAPYVLSGRGNGSAHYYVLTPQPLSGNERKSQSTEIVKVKMPSVERYSAKEAEHLTTQELQAGIRLRPAWEISVLSEGRQVVLPGSVHPDTGRHYKWGREPGDLPVIDVGSVKASAGVSAKLASGFPLVAFQDVAIHSLGLRPDQVASIVDGAGVTDRSASVFALTMAMLQRRVSERDILSVFTEREYYLGETAFDHAKTDNRQKAAEWLMKYTLPRAKQQTTESAFAHEVMEEVSKSDKEEAEKPKSEARVNEISGKGADSYQEAGNWKFELDLQPGPKGALPQIRSTFKNIQLILVNSVGPDFLRFDVFAQREFWAYDVPWGPRENDQRSGGTQDEIKLKSWLIEVWGVETSVNLITETLAWFSGQNQFHPVKDYLETLSWDGVPRIEKAFETYLGVKMPREYTRAVSKKFFLALISRIYEPGCKFDHLPVLEGRQGIGKSTFGRILVSDKWFMDGLPDLSDKDAALNLQGIWLCEMSELSSLYRSQLEVAKGFITRQVDKVRPPYGARRVELPRQTVFLGTTNDREYLVDQTGNRRFWPVLISGCHFAKLLRDREQLLAEAHWVYTTDNEPLYLQGEAEVLAKKIQETRRVEDDFDSMLYKVREWVELPAGKRTLKDISRVRIDDVFDGPLFGVQKNMATRKTAGLVLRKLGYLRVQNRGLKIWVKSKGKPGRPLT